MTIRIDSSRVSTAFGAAARTLEDRRRAQNAPSAPPPVPKRAHINIIPSPESLATLIRSAVAALKGGKAWDRGTILNLLV